MLVTWSTTALPCDRHSHVIGILMDQGCGAVQMLQPKDWALRIFLHFRHWAGADLSPSQHISKHVLLSQELYCLVTRDLHPEMPQSRKVKAVDCSRQQYFFNKHQIATKQFESQTLVFSPEIWIQKYATKPQIVKKCPLPHGAVGNFSAPVAIHGWGWRTCWWSAAPSPKPCRCGAESWTAMSGAWAPSTAWRSPRWATWGTFWSSWGSSARRRWCAVLQSPWRVDGAAFCVGPSWEKCRETITAFSDHLKILSSM